MPLINSYCREMNFFFGISCVVAGEEIVDVKAIY